VEQARSEARALGLLVGRRIHTGARSEDSDGQCLLVIIGVKPDGSKERVAIADGYRESKASWRDLLLDLKARGLQAGPLLAAGDGAMGLWAALEEGLPQTKQQRCGFHKIGTVLNALLKGACQIFSVSRS